MTVRTAGLPEEVLIPIAIPMSVQSFESKIGEIRGAKSCEKVKGVHDQAGD